jgi:5-methylcytosine-specific restriction endonuclease McrA
MPSKKLIKNRVTDEQFRNACSASKSMAAAAAKLNIHFNSFKKSAIALNCYRPNQAGKGLIKISPKIPLDEIIINGSHPLYQSFKLKRRLFAEGIKKNKCEVCGLTSWLKKPINLELHHKDGNSKNHKLNNLVLLCPNCHSQTDTFRAKNRKI